MKKVILPFLISAGVLVCHQSIGQIAPKKQWDTRFGGSGNELAYSAQQTFDGGYVIAGHSDSGISGDKSQTNNDINSFTTDYWIVKTDSAGNKVWEKSFGGNKDDLLYTLARAADGGFLLGGVSSSGISGDKTQTKGGGDFWIVKIDANGNKLWEKSIGGTAVDVLNDMKQTSDGGFILGGISWSLFNGDRTQPSKGLSDAWIVKIDASGNKVWDKAFGGIERESITSIEQTADGGYILGGISQSNISVDKSQNCFGDNDYWIIKLDALGNKQWDKTFGGDKMDILINIQQTGDGGYIVGGTSESGLSGNKIQPTKGANDYWIIKLDASGNKIWEKSFGGTAHESFGSLIQIKDGGYILAGSSGSGISGDKSEAKMDTAQFAAYDVWLIKLDVNGNKIWDKSYGGSSIDLCTSIQKTKDGGFILGGGTDSDFGYDVTQPSRGKRDMWLLKFAPEKVESKAIITDDISIYPNPLIESFTIEVKDKQVHHISVYNTLGRQVLAKSIFSDSQADKLKIDLANEAKGVYTIRIVTGNRTVTRRVVLQ